MKSIYLYDTQIGKIGIADNGIAITDLYFDGEGLPSDIKINETKLIKEAWKQLTEYFLGNRKEFKLPLFPEGTEFQNKVWMALQDIPFGETRSYGEIAKTIGNSKAARAVGMANNRNPIPIFIPCHRVIGANGSLVGYGGGLKIKEYLLTVEKINYNKNRG
jgi:methylated-DNA-[protein]-cysteine S-methyltransferase